MASVNFTSTPGIGGASAFRAIQADPEGLPGLMRTPAEMREAAEAILQRRRAMQQSTTSRTHLVNLERSGRDLSFLESLRRGPAAASASIPSSTASSKGTATRPEVFESILTEVVNMSLEAHRQAADARILKQLDDDWETTKVRVFQQMNERPSAPSSTTNERLADTNNNKLVVVAKREESPKMSEFYSLIRQASLSPAELCDRFRSASLAVGLNADACELWSTIKCFINGDPGTMERTLTPTNVNCKRALAARAFLELQRRDRHGINRSVVLIWDQDFQRCKSFYEKIYRMCRVGEWKEAARRAGEIDQPLQMYLHKFMKCSKGVYDVSVDEADPFKKALAGLWDPQFVAGEGVVECIEDFIWHRLCAVTCAMEGHAVVAIAQAKGVVAEIENHGPGYFEAASNPFLYARVLATCGAVESAISFLATFTPGLAVSTSTISSAVMDPLPDAVHLAVVLSKAKCLQTTTATPSSSIVDDKGELNLGRLLEMYASRFSDLEKAMYYATSLPPPVVSKDCLPAKKILARPLPNGGPLPLLKIMKKNIGDDKSASIAVDAAAESRPEDAVSIYREILDGNLFPPRQDEVLDNALLLIAKELARVMVSEPTLPERTFWKREAERFRGYSESSASVTRTMTLFKQVMSCTDFYDQFWRGNEDAPLLLEQWLLPPSRAERTRAEVVQRANEFLQHSRIIVDAFPVLVNSVIECNERAFAKGKKEEARARLGSLIDFIAVLRDKVEYRLRSDVERRLAQADSSIRT